MAQKADADNKADTVYIPQYLAINDTEMQDDIVTLHYEIKDDYDRNKLLHYFEYYGLNTNEVDTPFSDSRLNYDYVQTQNSDLSNIIKNQYEREEIEKALNNGITKWHIDTCYSEAIKTFDRQYINYQNSIGIADGFLNEGGNKNVGRSQHIPRKSSKQKERSFIRKSSNRFYSFCFILYHTYKHI